MVKDQTAPNTAPPAAPLAYSVKQFCDLTSISRGQVTIERAAGRLRCIKVGKRVLIPFEAAQAFINGGAEVQQ